MKNTVSFNEKTVLITSASHVTGQGILKCLLRMGACRPQTIAIDSSKLAIGLYWADKAFIVPPCSQEDIYLAKIKQICQEFAVSVVFPGSDKEARILTYSQEWLPQHPVFLAASPSNIWDVTGDKLSIYSTARELDIASPYTLLHSESAIAAIIAQYGLPFLIKPRRNSGGRDIRFIQAEKEIPNNLDSIEYIVQQYLGPDSKEFTVGFYSSPSGKSASPEILIAMERTLYYGNTISARFIQTHLFEEPIAHFSERLGIKGYCNFQFIENNGIPHLTDVNARFSSSISIGTELGCNFVQIYLEDQFYNIPPKGVRSNIGKMVIRYLNDYALDIELMEQVPELSDSNTQIT